MAPHDTASPVPGEAVRLDTPERRLLAVMRLHAITAVHGEDGLRDRLLIEAGRFPASDRARIGGRDPGRELPYRPNRSASCRQPPLTRLGAAATHPLRERRRPAQVVP